MEKAYEKPQILETMPIEQVLRGEMGEGIAPEWVNWNQSWNNSWLNTGVVPQPEGETSVLSN
ncbi:hypothetical protein J7M22_06520 [Candidatus Poribacteria bacterium]|nr:hypothetical protein [Candidatus Poribacteria bacterium]